MGYFYWRRNGGRLVNDRGTQIALERQCVLHYCAYENIKQICSAEDARQSSSLCKSSQKLSLLIWQYSLFKQNFSQPGKHAVRKLSIWRRNVRGGESMLIFQESEYLQTKWPGNCIMENWSAEPVAYYPLIIDPPWAPSYPLLRAN